MSRVGVQSPLCEETIRACSLHYNCSLNDNRSLNYNRCRDPTASAFVLAASDFANTFTVRVPLETAGPHGRGLSVWLVGPHTIRVSKVLGRERRARMDQGGRSACQKGEDVS